MATRLRNRRALRDQQTALEDSQPAVDTTDSDTSEETPPKTKKPRTRKVAADKPAKVKAPAKPRVRKKSVKAPPRMFAHWVVCDNAMKRVAVFEYRDRSDADAKLIEMQERKPGGYFLVLTKDAYVPTDVPVAAE